MSDIQPGVITAPTPKKSRKKAWILVGVLVLIIILLASTSSKSPSKSSNVSSASVSSTIAPTTSTTFSPVQQWAAAHSGVFGTLGNDMGNIGTQIKQDLNTGNYASVSAACSQLGADAKTDAALPPIPDAGLEQKLAQILANLQVASTSCVSGIANNDTNQLTQTMNLFTTVDSEVASLNTAILSFAG